MKNFKKQLNLFKKSVKDPNLAIRQLAVADAVENCELLEDYEKLIKRPIKDSEFNLICNFIYEFGSNLDVNLITYDIFTLLTQDEEFEQATSTRKALFKLKDLNDKTKESEIIEYIYNLTMEYSDDLDYFF